MNYQKFLRGFLFCGALYLGGCNREIVLGEGEDRFTIEVHRGVTEVLDTSQSAENYWRKYVWLRKQNGKPNDGGTLERLLVIMDKNSDNTITNEEIKPYYELEKSKLKKILEKQAATSPGEESKQQ